VAKHIHQRRRMCSRRFYPSKVYNKAKSDMLQMIHAEALVEVNSYLVQLSGGLRRRTALRSAFPQLLGPMDIRQDY